MAITRSKKEQIVADVTSLLQTSKLTVIANYSGLTVKDMQELRRMAREQGVSIKVAKNRLVRLATGKIDHLKGVDTSMMIGQVTIAVSEEDEVAPAQVLAEFAKTHPAMEFIGGFNAEGELFDQAQITALSKLPSKDVLRGQLVGTIAAPLTGFVSVMAGNIRGLQNVLSARAQAIES